MSEDIEEIKKRLNTISLSLKFGITVMILSCGLKIASMLIKGGNFSGIYDAMLGGAKLPASTSFVLEYSGWLLLFVFVLSAGTIASLYVFGRSRWPIPLGVAVSMFFVFGNQFVTEAYFAPIIGVIKNLTG